MIHEDALRRYPVDESAMLDIFQMNLESDDWVLSVQLQDSHSRCKYIHKVLTRTTVDQEETYVTIYR